MAVTKPIALVVLLCLSQFVSAQPMPNPQEIQFRVPMACAADATIRAAEYPEAIRVYDDGQPPRSFEEADRAALGLLWRHRRAFAEEVAVAAFRKLFDRPPTDEELSDEHSRWVRTLMSYPNRCVRPSRQTARRCTRWRIGRVRRQGRAAVMTRAPWVPQRCLACPLSG